MKDTVIVAIDQCREGYIDRIFYASDQNNTVTCSQRIYVINNDPFGREDITWPKDFTTTSCDSFFLLPDNLPDSVAYPKLIEDECDLTGITYKDEIFPFVPNVEACYKIIRTWRVVNWCRFFNGQYEAWSWEQVIKVHNNVEPTITSSCDPKSICTFDDNCEGGEIELFATAVDDCTPGDELVWEYHIDLDYDGTFDISESGSGDSVNATDTYRIGQHVIYWTFEDRCGNKKTCAQEFEIVNCKAPLVYCRNGIVVDLVPMDLNGDGECDIEMVEIWAEDLDDGSNHPCGYDLTYSFGIDTSVHSIMLDCQHIGIVNVTLCVTDENGNQACCETVIIVQDNNDEECCPGR